MKIQHVSDASKRAFDALPKSEREDFANALRKILKGETSALKFKPLNNLGKNIKGVMELVINGSPAFRVVYVTKFNNTLYLLHAFTKTTNGVDRKAMDVVVKRYKEIPK